MASPRVRAALDDLLGPWCEPADWGQPLVCFPAAQRAWSLPRQGWHFDGPIDPAPQRSLIGRVFVILEPLRPTGGATLVATGSHRIAMALADAAGVQQSSGEMRKKLQGLHPWFAELMHGEGGAERTARYMDRETTVSGVPLRLQEMTGEPGDVWLMHHNALHGGSPNVLDRPRLALSQFVQPKP
jgi:ectoine hydroxylase-related dioxygenase (phytanoyl-CoA dioxygenase family)